MYTAGLRKWTAHTTHKVLGWKTLPPQRRPAVRATQRFHQVRTVQAARIRFLSTAQSRKRPAEKVRQKPISPRWPDTREFQQLANNPRIQRWDHRKFEFDLRKDREIAFPLFQ